LFTERFYGKPTLLDTPNNVSITVGGNLNLTCNFLYDTFDQVSWIKNSNNRNETL